MPYIDSKDILKYSKAMPEYNIKKGDLCIPEMPPIRSILVGNVPHQREVILSIKVFLKEIGKDNIEVKSADVAYRA